MERRALLARGLVIGVAASCVVVVIFFWLRGGSSPGYPTDVTNSTVAPTTTLDQNDPRLGVPVRSYTPVRWLDLTTGEWGTLDEVVTRLSRPEASDLGAEDATAAVAVAKAFATADLAGIGREAFPLLFDNLPAIRPCTNFSIVGAWADRLPSSAIGPYAVAQVLWAGECVNGGTPESPASSRVYLQKVNGRWTAIDPATIP